MKRASSGVIIPVFDVASRELLEELAHPLLSEFIAIVVGGFGTVSVVSCERSS